MFPERITWGRMSGETGSQATVSMVLARSQRMIGDRVHVPAFAPGSAIPWK